MRILITGANRGIGLAMARLYTETGATVYGTARDVGAATDLAQVATVLPLDVADETSIAAMAAQLHEYTDTLDVLVNNAGIVDRAGDRLGNVVLAESLRVFRVNAIGPVLVAKALLPLLRAGENARVVNITSNYGSITERTFSGLYDYAASKTALNMYTHILARDVAPVIAVVVHPGWVRTRMGTDDAELSVTESTAGLVRVIEGLTPENSGKFYDWMGNSRDW